MLTCPICALAQTATDGDNQCCPQCGWDFPVFLGTGDEVRVVLRQRLEEARTAWQRRRYNPDLVPDLVRDPFDTVAEFAERVKSHPWYVGQGELQKAGYDIKTGRFPLRFSEVRDWAAEWLARVDDPHPIIPRDEARQIWQQSPVWPVYAWLEANGEQAELLSLGLVTQDRGLPVRARSPYSDLYRRKYSEAQYANITSQFSLGLMFEQGRGVEKDEAEAVCWYRKAVGRGDTFAQRNLDWMIQKSRGVKKDEPEAVCWYRKAAEQGIAVAQNYLGWMFEEGWGVEKDEAEAVRWYRKAADQGYADSERSLGWMFEDGRGVEKDYAEAVRWYRKAVDQGDATAQINLGWMFQNGWGVEQDYAEAVRWYRKAVDQGLAFAHLHLGWMFENGWGVEQDEAEAVRWYRKAADKGLAFAQYYLGSMFQTGQGVGKDEAEAVRWYRKAAEQGDEDARQALDALERSSS
jgi:TPR repeat protein